MGFFDKISGIINTIDKAANAVEKLNKAADSFNKSSDSESKPADSGSTAQIKPLKPSRIISDTIYDTAPDGSDAGIPYSFSLSESFVESRSHAAEIDLIYAYAPDCGEDFLSDEYVIDNELPYFIISGGEQAVYDAVEQFKKSGSIAKADIFEKVNMGKMLFRARIPYFNEIMYFYGFDKGYSWKNMGIGVIYNKKYKNTELEKLLMKATDEAASTYKEEL